MLTKIWTSLCLSAAAVCTVGWFVALMHEHGIRPVCSLVEFFRKQSKAGRIVFAAFSLGLWIYAANKPGDGSGSGGSSGDDAGGTNTEERIGMDLGDAGTNDTMFAAFGLPLHIEGQGGLSLVESGDMPAMLSMGGETVFGPVTSTNTARQLTDEDFRRGFVLTRTGTGESFDFSAPSNADVCDDWRAFGAAEDWGYAAFTNGTFRLGTNDVDRFRIFSFGRADALVTNETGRILTWNWLAPFRASLGIVPEANWNLLDCNAVSDSAHRSPSQFWSSTTPSNTFRLTWQNVLLNRETNCPVSFQAELWPSGKFLYRYDLSRCGGRGATALPDGVLSNVLVGASFGGNAWMTNALPTNVTSLAFHPLTAEDAANPDRDGDGLSLLDELFVHNTDPENVDSDYDGFSDGEEVSANTNPRTRDSDGDGLVDGSDPEPGIATSLADLDGDSIPDAYENHWLGGTNVFDTATERDATGFTLNGRILCGINPTNAADAARIVSTNALVSWKLFGRFAMDLPSGATNLVWERTFAVNRSSAWQQFFITAAPTNATGWYLLGAVLEWATDTGSTGSVSASPFGDSYRLPLAAGDLCASLTLRIRATGASTVCSPMPLHLVAYAPQFRLDGVDPITGESGTRYFVFDEGSDSAMNLVIDHSLRPCRAALCADESDVGELEEMGAEDGDFSYDGDASGGRIFANRPGVYALPDWSLGVSTASAARLRASARRSGGSGGDVIVVLDPSVGWRCAGHGCFYDGLCYDWDSDSYAEESYYPLDTKCLRKKWYRTWDGGWNDGNCELEVSSGLGEDAPSWVTTSVRGSTGTISVDGVEVWSGTAEHVYDGTGCGGSSPNEDSLADECDSCDTDCANGNCDTLEGPSLGSLKFRIPLGVPVKGQVAGFVWFATETPRTVSQATFQLLRHPDATISDTTVAGVRQIICSDSRGRDLRIENIANGVRITIRETVSQTLEHTWEITNVDGSSSRIRLRKISRQNNVMSDETYTYADGDWTSFDNIAGVGTTLAVESVSESDDGVRRETRTTTDADGNILASVTTEQSRIGECDNAVLRETYRCESTGLGIQWSQADYWNDPAHALRHGQMRLVRGNARAWVYTDFDENGHEILCIEQRNGSPIPQTFPTLSTSQPLNFSTLSDAFVTIRDYEPIVGDSCHSDDAAKPRTETRYVVENGVATLIGRSWTRYTRLVRDGYAAIKKETWRAGTPNASVVDVGNAYSYAIFYADTGDGTPLLMRDAEAESLDEDGILTVNTYAISGGILSCTTRRYGPDGTTQFPTYEVTDSDASYGTVLRRTTRLASDDTVIADEQSIYDDKNRLRSTSYLDGTSLTNAYSCCRLLWSRDREGRQTLRSAETGRDHLYYAMEDVWLADVSTNGRFRVTQHFFDALGRETNTVVYAGTTPGEATVASASEGKVHSRVTTTYPYGGSDYSIRTDERGKATVRRTDILDGCTETGETVFTNGVEVVSTKSRSFFGGGSSTRREWGGSCFTEERRFDEYAADGRRTAYVLTESSDCGVVTNSATTYDLLGRAVSTTTPLSDTVNAYDGNTSRVLTTTDAKSGVTTICLYDACGEQIGTQVNGVTNASVAAYEQISNEIWKVVTDSVVGPSTNSWTTTRTRLTGLNAGCRSESITQGSQGGKTHTLVSDDPDTGIRTETSDSMLTGERTVESRHGIELVSHEPSGVATNAYDVFGHCVRTVKGDVVREYDYDPVGALIAKRTLTATNVLVETQSYDMLGQKVEVTDALGQSTATIYDAVGNVVEVSGATYPVRSEYDTAGRRTALLTTRDGTSWDRTSWNYDAATGLFLRKTYADGTFETYSYTDDGLLATTTRPGGQTLANVYDVNRKLVRTYSNDGLLDRVYGRDAYGRIVTASNAVARTARLLHGCGIATNETWTVGSNAATITRSVDSVGRMDGLIISGTGYTQHFAYTSDNLIGTISNADAVVTYTYAADRSETGYVLSLANGTTFTRSVTRDTYRPELVTSVTNTFGSTVRGFAYTYDDLSRPISRNDDSFGYNGRGEVAEAIINGNVETHAYDSIGNSVLAAFQSVTNTYAANALNQYTSVVGETTCAPTYNANGDLLTFGVWSFTYDDDSRLLTISSNSVLLVTNAYDYQGRRVRKTTPDAVTTFLYDEWNLIREMVAYTSGGIDTFEYFWGRDLSGTLQGAGGVGGLLYVKRNGTIYIPFTDANGNITAYADATGSLVAEYVYDAFGRNITQSGSLADVFRHRFSSKCFDPETGLYYYGYRFYNPALIRWLTRDPIRENGGFNVYAFCCNNSIGYVDRLGLYLWYVLYYDENKNGSNFKRAAETRKNIIERAASFNPKCDKVELYSIRTESDFSSVWSTLNAHSRVKSKRVTRFQVKGLYLYTHSGPGELYMRGATIEAEQIKHLPVLNWAQGAEIQCLGCNSGVENVNGDSLAGSFYDSQGVPSLGQSGYSSFSSSPDRKKKWGVVLGFTDVYLWAFDINGNKLAPVQYPKKEGGK